MSDSKVSVNLYRDFDSLSLKKRTDMLSELKDQDLRNHVEAFDHPSMVRFLAKDGEVIVGELNYNRFLQLANQCWGLVQEGMDLDALKKQVIYNKEVEPEMVPLMNQDALRSSFGSLTAEKAHLIHMAVGLAGEATEMLHAIFNHVFQGADLDVENVIEEGGDASFYLQGIIGSDSVQANPTQIALANKIKLLGKRYKNGYSDQAAQERADKVEPSA